jgi:cytochrome c oxidase cbb3-type subunit 1
MSSSTQNPAYESTEVGRIDSSLRSTGLVFGISGALWLVFAGITGLFAYLQIVVPTLFECVPFLTFGRLKVVAVNALTHGWATNAGFLLIIWIMSRLSERAPDFDIRRYLLVPAGVVYNILVTYGLLAIFWGEAGPHFLLEIPSQILGACALSYILITIWTILDYFRRKRRTPYVSQYFILGAVFWLAWIFSISQLILGDENITGVIQAVAASWLAHAYIWLWLVPIGCAVAYYLLPKLSGVPIHHYYLAFFSFWCLAFIGPWGGHDELVGGPFPAWIQKSGVIAGVLLCLPVISISINLWQSCFRPSVRPKLKSLCKSPSGRFVVTGIIAFPIFGLLTAFDALPNHKEGMQFTYWQDGIFYLGLYGFYSMIAAGGIYFILPRLFGREWKSAGLMHTHYIYSVVGSILVVVGFFWGGLAQAEATANLEKNFVDISFITWMPVLLAVTGFFSLVIGQIAFLINIMRISCACPLESSSATEGPTLLATELDERSNA